MGQRRGGSVREAIVRLHAELRAARGEPDGQWAFWCRRPKTAAEREAVVIEAVLTQRTNWANVERAAANLRAAGVFSLAGVLALGPAGLAPLVRPSGFYRRKAERLVPLARLVAVEWGGVERALARETAVLRAGLLALPGVGPETADDILLYALDKPVFVVDEYTRRIARSRGIAALSYNGLQRAFEEALPRDYGVYQDFHALIVMEGKAAR